MLCMRGKIAVALLLLAVVLAALWALTGERAAEVAMPEPVAGEPLPVTSPVKVASLHPLLSEMARSIGGNAITVVDLFPAASDLHAFTPAGADIAAAAGSRLLLACGKGVEPYLRDLRDSLPASTAVLELGAAIPDVSTPGGGGIPDPHWWSTPTNMKRASLALAAALQQAAPAEAQGIAARQQAWAAAMDALTRRARLELTRIPAAQRVLVTEHAAMCHFCEEFHFTPIPVQGVAQESEGDTASLARLLGELRTRGVPCLFADVGDSPRFLQNLAAQLGARLHSLYMDGVHPTGEPLSYEEMFLHNLRAIRSGLEPTTTVP